MNFTIGKKIGLGFGIVIALMAVSAGVGYWKLNQMMAVEDRVIELRYPTVRSADQMMNGMNHSLAALRGYMILGKDPSKADLFTKDRQAAWEEIDSALATMQEFSKTWTDPTNIERLEQLTAEIEQFRTAQAEIEQIAQTVENIPATKLLLEEAAPKTKILGTQITRMIDLEAEYDTSSILDASQGAVGAMQLAKVIAEQVITDRAYYTKNVIGKLKNETEFFKAGSDFHNTKGAIPLPATFVRETSNGLGEDAGYRYDLLSKWNINEEMGLRDDFEEQAWKSLSADPETHYAEFVRVGAGVEYRYASADVANVQGCISCHNNHGDSPKTDFQLGDLMGILVVSTAVTQDPAVADILVSLGSTDGTKANVTEADAQSLLDNVIQRKALLGMMADTRGTLGLGLGAVRAYLLSGDESFKDQFDTLWSKNTRRFGQIADNLYLLTPEQREAYDIFKETREAFDPLPPQMFAIRGGDSWNLANQWLGTKAAPRARQIKSVLGEMLVSQENLVKTDQDVLASAGQALTYTMILTTVVATIIGCIVAVFLSRRIAQALLRVVGRAEEIAAGDLTGNELDIRSQDEIGSLTTAVNAMSGSLKSIVTNLNMASNQVASAATEIASTSDEMARGSDEQTAQISQVSAAMEEMSTSIIEVARKSSEAASQAKKAGDDAGDGGEIVQNTVVEIDAIAQQVADTSQSVAALGSKSEEIGQIIDVINDIADQTNLLALNAAIEAARAGEHGRGFAVVADEVRKLAERTTKATEEVGTSIGEIQDETKRAVERMEGARQQVTKGVELANEAGTSLEGIVGGANSVSGEINDIAAAAEEQSATAEEISQTIESVAGVVRQSAEGASQAATAAAQLSGNAEELQQLIAQFKVA